jgi:hypothetical protein
MFKKPQRGDSTFAPLGLPTSFRHSSRGLRHLAIDYRRVAAETLLAR